MYSTDPNYHNPSRTSKPHPVQHDESHHGAHRQAPFRGGLSNSDSAHSEIEPRLVRHAYRGRQPEGAFPEYRPSRPEGKRDGKRSTEEKACQSRAQPLRSGTEKKQISSADHAARTSPRRGSLVRSKRAAAEEVRRVQSVLLQRRTDSRLQEDFPKTIRINACGVESTSNTKNKKIQFVQFDQLSKTRISDRAQEGKAVAIVGTSVPEHSNPICFLQRLRYGNDYSLWLAKNLGPSALRMVETSALLHAVAK
jgi:hypothetical protein